jgi:3-hydroxyisobutyrate dehydrogenase
VVVDKVGVLGLGNMGRGMAASLQRAGFDVSGFDAAPAALQRAAQDGLRPAGSVAELAGAVDALVLSLPASAIVEAVVFADDGVLAGARPGLIVIDTTTADPASTRRVAAALHDKGIRFIDAPVSGGAKGAASASLTMVLGGAAADIAAAEPVLQAMSARRTPVGPVSAGHVVKLLNNLLCGAHLLIAGEAVRAAKQGGLDPATVLAAINGGSGRSAVTEVNFPTWILDEQFDSGFTMKLMRKDIALARALFDDLGITAPFAQACAGLWADSSAQLADGEDFNRIVAFEPK